MGAFFQRFNCKVRLYREINPQCKMVYANDSGNVQFLCHINIFKSLRKNHTEPKNLSHFRALLLFA